MLYGYMQNTPYCIVNAFLKYCGAFCRLRLDRRISSFSSLEPAAKTLQKGCIRECSGIVVSEPWREFQIVRVHVLGQRDSRARVPMVLYVAVSPEPPEITREHG